MKKLLCLSTVLLLLLSLTAGCLPTPIPDIESGGARRIGNAEFGFITVPADTFTADFMDIGYTQAGISHVGFRCISDMSTIVLVDMGNFGDDIRLGMLLEVMGLDNPTNVVVGGFHAYRTYTAFPDGISMNAWFFFDGDNNVRHITAGGPPERAAELVEIVEGTFSFER